jgi:PLP dependent protein
MVNKQALLQRWHMLHDELAGEDVRLLAVSKYAPDEAVRCLIEAGQMDFAESRPQNLRDRALRYPSVRWHMIGPLQKNKAKYIARHAAAWHSVEDIETARAVADLVSGRRLPVFVQVNVAGMTHQHGVCPDAVQALCSELVQLPQLSLAGLMCIAPRQGDAKACFSTLRNLRDTLLSGSLLRPDACQGWPETIRLCMGMSGDYRIAIAEGTDIVRIGSGLFDAGSE